MREIKRILDIEKPLTCDVLTNSEFETSMLQCRLNVTEDISGNVLFMYRIKNFYQNHRMYQSTLYNNELARSEVIGFFITIFLNNFCLAMQWKILLQ